MTRIILVKTCQKFIARREACEATWVSALRREGVPVFFVTGGDVESFDGYTIQTASGDGYNDNSFKVRDAVRVLLANVAFDHLFICDDNTFVHPGRWLEHRPGGEFEGLQTAKIPHCHGGGGWWFSRKCCAIYAASIKRKCSWDDQLATEILRRHGIAMVNRPDLYSQWYERISTKNTLITCHNVEPREMVELFNATNEPPVLHLLSGA